jgi:hypothetical protein
MISTEIAFSAPGSVVKVAGAALIGARCLGDLEKAKK